MTRDYLDTRFRQFKAEIEAEIEKRFAGIDVRFEPVDVKFRLIFWMQALTIVCVVVPAVRDLFG